MNYNYAEKWSRSYKEAIKPLTEAQARKRHEKKGALYTVLLGDDSARPHAFAEIVSADSIQVDFLDKEFRSFASYQFVQQADGRLFMAMAVFREFDSETMKNVFGRSLHFKPDGYVLSIEEDFRTNTQTRQEKTMDVSLNWEPYPEFGDYESIVRLDRDAPPGKSQDTQESEFS